MTYEDYIKRKKELEKKLAEITDEFLNSGEVKVGSIIVNDKGEEFIVRKMMVWFNKAEVDEVSKRKKNGEWSEQTISRFRVGKYRLAD